MSHANSSIVTSGLSAPELHIILFFLCNSSLSFRTVASKLGPSSANAVDLMVAMGSSSVPVLRELQELFKTLTLSFRSKTGLPHSRGHSLAMYSETQWPSLAQVLHILKPLVAGVKVRTTARKVTLDKSMANKKFK